MTREEFLDILELGTNENTEGLCFKLLSENKEFLTSSFFVESFGRDFEKDLFIGNTYISLNFSVRYSNPDIAIHYLFYMYNYPVGINNGINRKVVEYLKSLHGN